MSAIGRGALLLSAVGALGFVGGQSLGKHLVRTLGLVLELGGMLYGALGVSQSGPLAMVRVWNIPSLEVPGSFHRFTRSLVGMMTIGLGSVVAAVPAASVTGGGHSFVQCGFLLVGMAALNVVLYLVAFWALTPAIGPVRVLLPGATASAAGFTFIIPLGSGLVQHNSAIVLPSTGNTVPSWDW